MPSTTTSAKALPFLPLHYKWRRIPFRSPSTNTHWYALYVQIDMARSSALFLIRSATIAVLNYGEVRKIGRVWIWASLVAPSIFFKEFGCSCRPYKSRVRSQVFRCLLNKKEARKQNSSRFEWSRKVLNRSKTLQFLFFLSTRLSLRISEAFPHQSNRLFSRNKPSQKELYAPASEKAGVFRRTIQAAQ